jgi:hypothetical protein
MAHAGSDQVRQFERQPDRRGTDRRIEQQVFVGNDRREGERRSGRDRRGS